MSNKFRKLCKDYETSVNKIKIKIKAIRQLEASPKP